ncbi:inactive protein kinase SELMODRAFT_444075-like [Zingiber officinale]|uniref:inactive protein kinase SELMODRAFT_444075-like n=1 Tax=Zingiber officinale TaxID=94328 RepID=UPI001C4D5FA9|nr:inactive protein kinase SELMODRAFT_444075-like [Zingiber officinale]XP_042408497.1 inactive protein kinase SELMODRAFT_444075-like [Zingiber officinale]
MTIEEAGKRKMRKKDETFEHKMEEDDGGVAGKTVVVGVRTDPQSRELLTWALVKAAATGDRVVALHVLHSSQDPGDRPAAVFSIAKDLDGMLTAYEGFCNLKQIDLKLKICKGSSIRKVLVSEAISFSASMLVLGVNKNSHAARSPSISVAKFCAKRLQSNCSVVALNEGKIVFQREAADNSKSQRKSGKPSMINRDESYELFCLLPMVGQRRLIEKDSDTASILKDQLNGCRTRDKNSLSTVGVSPRNSCSICAPENDAASSNELKNGGQSALVPLKKSEVPPSNSMTAVAKDLPEAWHGWSLLKRSVLTFQWAKRLPSRQTSVHPDCKSKKLDGDARVKFEGENGEIVRVQGDSPPPVCLVTDAEGRLHEELQTLQEKYSSVCRLFSHEDLVQATSDFSQENLIGKGGSSIVYKGHLSDGKELAVKLLKPSEDALKEFISEIEIITSLNHKNIISLLGFCFENNILILVYDYVSQGSLEDLLHGENANKHVLSWAERYKVAVGVAEALDYLHGGGSTERVIHRDVKSSNILLSDDFEPQLSDFGLAKWSSASTSQPICDDVAGTFGYLAPEYILFGKVDEKIDVYAYGVVLLELLTGRKPISAGCPKGQESLVLWAKPILQDGDVKKIIDPCLKNEFDSTQVERMILAASLCVRRHHSARPQISLVLKLLQGDNEVVECARAEVSSHFDVEGDEIFNLESDIRSHLTLALLDVDNGTNSVSSTASTSVENYLQWTWSRSD